jgi:cytidine deaminase
MEAPRTLIEAAEKVAQKAYAPHSEVHVGAAVWTKAGALYVGCNVENDSFGLTICAERAAIFTGVAAEGPSFRVREVAVIALGREFPPCGACRQVIKQFSDPEVRVWFLQNGTWTSLTVAELLPASFTLPA